MEKPWTADGAWKAPVLLSADAFPPAYLPTASPHSGFRNAIYFHVEVLVLCPETLAATHTDS